MQNNENVFAFEEEYSIDDYIFDFLSNYDSEDVDNYFESIGEE
jgi:hypothetical protein